ncbi:MAG: hypothetical protein M3354_07745 [Chloroflexota bacterium]|nr:hypothetical protein [Chloroflexota bacterium]
MHRVQSAEAIAGSLAPVGLALGAADPNLIVFAYASGVVLGHSSYGHLTR